MVLLSIDASRNMGKENSLFFRDAQEFKLG
jgi:hypothetical protein